MSKEKHKRDFAAATTGAIAGATIGSEIGPILGAIKNVKVTRSGILGKLPLVGERIIRGVGEYAGHVISSAGAGAMLGAGLGYGAYKLRNMSHHKKASVIEGFEQKENKYLTKVAQIMRGFE